MFYKKNNHVEAWKTKDYATMKETLRPWWIFDPWNFA